MKPYTTDLDEMTALYQMFIRYTKIVSDEDDIVNGAHVRRITFDHNGDLTDCVMVNGICVYMREVSE